MGQWLNAIKTARLSEEKKLIVMIWMRYGTNKEKNTKLGEGLIKMTGKGEPWHTKVVVNESCDLLPVKRQHGTSGGEVSKLHMSHETRSTFFKHYSVLWMVSMNTEDDQMLTCHSWSVRWSQWPSTRWTLRLPQSRSSWWCRSVWGLTFEAPRTIGDDRWHIPLLCKSGN